MTTCEIFENLLKLNQIAAKELICTYFKKSGKQTSLVFPISRNGVVRVSEQELRFAMTNLFEKNNNSKLTFSVETPTEKLYTFKGTEKRSGSSDLSFYESDVKILNIELKANNPSQESIDKDIEKLVKEECYGAWCHIFKNEDRGTLNSVFNKLKIALKKKGDPEKPLYFSFLILNAAPMTGKLISRKGLDSDLTNFSPDFLFDLKYSQHKNLTEINKQFGDWQINHY